MRFSNGMVYATASLVLVFARWTESASMDGVACTFNKILVLTPSKAMVPFKYGLYNDTVICENSFPGILVLSRDVVSQKQLSQSKHNFSTAFKFRKN